MRERVRKRWVRWYVSRGLTARAIAFVLEEAVETIEHDIATRRFVSRPPLYPSDSRGRRDRPVAAQCANHIRRLRALGFSVDRVSVVINLNPQRVRDFIARIVPIRKTALVRPRTRPEQRAAVEAAARAAARQHERLELAERSAGWTYRDRQNVYRAEAAAHAALVEAVRSGRMPAGELLDQVDVADLPAIAAAPPGTRPRNEWVGPNDPHYRGPLALTAAEIAAARDRIVAGESWAAVARRCGVSRNTLRRWVGDVGTRAATVVYPTAPERHARGVVHWELPLLRARHVKVYVECQCGHWRHVEVGAVKARSFTGECRRCHFGPPALPRTGESRNARKNP